MTKTEENIEWVIDKVLKYEYAYLPGHPYANAAGKVYRHRYIIQNELGRILDKDEVVHHIDCDRSNNDISNLQLLTRSSHFRHHIQDLFKDGTWVRRVEKTCKVCKKPYFIVSGRSEKSFHCSIECRQVTQKKFDPSYEELYKMVWSMPIREVGYYYGVSDVAVHKRCKKLSITKPPKGYWIRKH